MSHDGLIASTEDERTLGETIMVVEDDAEVRRVVCLTLEMQGYRVLAAEHGEHALRLSATETGPIDLLLTDVVLPGLSGPKLYQKLRTRREHLRVLFMSGYDEEVVAGHGLASLDSHFLAKPFSSITLSRKLRLLLRISTQEHQPGHCAD